MQILVDADLILDYFLNRSAFVADAEEAFEILESNWIRGYISELGLRNIESALSLLGGFEAAQEIVSAITEVVEVFPVNSELMQGARSLNIRNIASSVEVACAKEKNIGAILTSDPKIFAEADLPILKVSDLEQRRNLERIWHEDSSPVLLVGDLPELQLLERLLKRSMDYRDNEDTGVLAPPVKPVNMRFTTPSLRKILAYPTRPAYLRFTTPSLRKMLAYPTRPANPRFTTPS